MTSPTSKLTRIYEPFSYTFMRDDVWHGRPDDRHDVLCCLRYGFKSGMVGVAHGSIYPGHRHCHARCTARFDGSTLPMSSFKSEPAKNH